MMSRDFEHKNKRDSLFDIKTAVLLLKGNMSSHLIGEVLYAQMEYDALVERYCAENRDLCSHGDCEAARQDVDAFIRLLDAAIEHYG